VDEAVAGAAHPQVAAAAARIAVVWDESDGGGSRRVWMREGVGAGSGEPVAPVWARPAALSAGPAGVYPAVAATPSATIVAWTEGSGAESVIRVRRIER
jgi:hypothetical protein